MLKNISYFLLFSFFVLINFTYAEEEEENGEDGKQAISVEFPIHECKVKRGNVNYKNEDNKKWAVDSVLWCPEDYPKAASCNTIDDTSPALGPTQITDCLADGACSNKLIADSRGSREGPQNQFREFISQDGGKIQGCWAYDVGNKHRPYRLEILCCK